MLKIEKLQKPTGKCPVGFHHTSLIDESRKVAEKSFQELPIMVWYLAMGGTITGEHGVGIGKKKYMHLEHDAGALAVMRSIKQALDPDNLMNPGKMLPENQ